MIAPRVADDRRGSAAPSAAAGDAGLGAGRLGLGPDPAPGGDLWTARVGDRPRGGSTAGFPPGRAVLVEERGHRRSDPRREVTGGLTLGRPQRRAEAYGDGLAAPARPALTAWHGGERAAMRDRDDRHLVLDGEPGGAHPEGADPAVDRAGSLRVDDQVPAVMQHVARGRSQ